MRRDDRREVGAALRHRRVDFDGPANSSAMDRTCSYSVFMRNFGARPYAMMPTMKKFRSKCDSSSTPCGGTVLQSPGSDQSVVPDAEAQFAKHFEVGPETGGDDILIDRQRLVRPSTFACNLSPSIVWSILQKLRAIQPPLSQRARGPRRAGSSSLMPPPISFSMLLQRRPQNSFVSSCTFLDSRSRKTLIAECPPPHQNAFVRADRLVLVEDIGNAAVDRRCGRLLPCTCNSLMPVRLKPCARSVDDRRSFDDMMRAVGVSIMNVVGCRISDEDLPWLRKDTVRMSASKMMQFASAAVATAGAR